MVDKPQDLSPSNNLAFALTAIAFTAFWLGCHWMWG